MPEPEKTGFTHRPVLLQEAVEALAIKPDGRYLDGTFGRGGHSREVLLRLGPQGRLFALDKDPAAIQAAAVLDADHRFAIEQSSFAELDRIKNSWVNDGFDGVLLDLGVSSPQLDNPDRGFSFMADGPLDMRMDPTQGVSAADWLAQAGEQEIARVLWEFGEERFARRIAKKIVMARQQQALTTTAQLVRLIEQGVARRDKHKHPATRSFQAIRIYINNELADLAKGLDAVIRHLRPAGKLVVISFHSLEDRMVKRTLREAARPAPVRRNLPADPAGKVPVLRLLGKPIRPSEQECSDNPRARSAIMRVAEKLKPAAIA